MNRLSWRDLGDRPAFFPAICLGIGAWLGGKTPENPWIFLTLSGFTLLLALRWARLPGAHLALLLATFGTGFGLSALQRAPRVPLSPPAEDPLRLEGEVEEQLTLEEGTRLLLDVARLPDAPDPRARFRAVLYAHGDVPLLLPGQRVLLPARLKPLDPALNEGQQDMRAAATRRALLYQGSFDPTRVVVLSRPSAAQVWRQRTHEALQRAVTRVAPSRESAALFLTLCAGLRAELGPDLEERFARSGLAHVLSVSGLHVAALALLLLGLARWLLLRPGMLAAHRDVRRPAALLALPFVWAYVAFTGNQPPAIRSALMASVMFLAMALWRRADALNSLALAALLLVAVDPASVADLSLQLSFLAVLSLILLAPALRLALPVTDPPAAGRPRAYVWQKLQEGGLQTLCASLAVTLASAPLLAAVFGRLGLVGIFSNIVCLPLCGVLTALSAAGAATFVVAPALATPLLWAGAWASQLLVWAVGFFARLPLSSLSTPAWGTLAWALYGPGLLAFSVAEGRARLLSWLAPLGALLGLGAPLLMPERGLEVTFLSVGHGDAIVLSSRGEHALVDGGGVPGADIGRKVVLPFLQSRRIDHLKLAVLSHPHPDHALGLASALAHLATERLWLPAGNEDGELTRAVVAAAGRAQVERVEVGRAPFTLGEATLEVLGPPRDRVLLEGVNDRSLVLRVRHGDVTLLLPGDIESAGEEVLSPGPITVMKAPHHGSGTSSSAALLAQAHPRFVVFCVGRHSRFHFPSPEVVQRYQALGARCFRTDLDGAVRVVSDGKDVKVTTFLPTQP